MLFPHKTKMRFTVGCCLLSAILIAACASSPKDLETPQGPVAGDQFGSMEIIGILSHSTTTMNRPKNSPQFKEDITLNVPVGTEFIIPAVRGWHHAFGELDPNTKEAHIGTIADQPSWKSEDHHFGVAAIKVSVKDINAPNQNASPPTQSATIAVDFILGDYNLDDKWFARVDYTLICLRRRQSTTTSPLPLQ